MYQLLAFSWFLFKMYVYLKIDCLIPAGYLLKRIPGWLSHQDDLSLLEDFTIVAIRK